MAGLSSSSSSSSSGSDALLPLLDLPSGSKISCLSFSPAVQQYLLSSDYAGIVQLWDLTGGCAAAQSCLLRLKVVVWFQSDLSY
jgi:WD40 repeat protein